MARTRRFPSDESTSDGHTGCTPGLGNRKGTAAHKPADDALRFARRQRREEALRLRLSGLSYREIGRQLGIHWVVAHKDVTRLLDQTPPEDVERYRDILTRRHERDLLRLEVDAQRARAILEDERNPDKLRLDAGRTVAALMGQRARALEALARLRVPQKHEHTGADGAPIEVRNVTSDELLARVDRFVRGHAESGAAEVPAEPVRH